MDPIALTELLTKYGQTGVIAVLLIVISVLDKRRQVVFDKTLADRDRIVSALNAAAEAARETRDILRQLDQNLDTRGKTVGELSNQVSIINEKMQHGFGNLSGALDGFLRLIQIERTRNQEDRDRATLDRGRDRERS